MRRASSARSSTKNATIGTGTKVPHLTYVGDADIGEHSNIGASSVFVNYDGEHKNRTTVGSHVRTGKRHHVRRARHPGTGLAPVPASRQERTTFRPARWRCQQGPNDIIEDWSAAQRPDSDSARRRSAPKQTASPPCIEADSRDQRPRTAGDGGPTPYDDRVSIPDLRHAVGHRGWTTART